MKIFRTSKALSLLAIVTLALSGCTSAAVGDLAAPADATVVDSSSESAPAASDRVATPTVAPTRYCHTVRRPGGEQAALAD
ncbi:hypothetical protein [Glutamicibacter sp. NPDC087344]|uniref:hypothetical protein n=1 Tax=Glutamicibacter sp. NPDC087344 TaxID=3363994 RepID=UPI0038102293